VICHLAEVKTTGSVFVQLHKKPSPGLLFQSLLQETGDVLYLKLDAGCLKLSKLILNNLANQIRTHIMKWQSGARTDVKSSDSAAISNLARKSLASSLASTPLNSNLSTF